MQRATLFTFLLLFMVSACSDREASLQENCAIEGCPMTSCEDKAWTTRTAAIQACAECKDQGYSDYGIIIGQAIDGRYDEAFYLAKKELVDSIYQFARLPIETSGFALVVHIMKNYCSENVDTSYRLIGTNITDAYDMAVAKKVNYFYRVVPRDSTALYPYWWENVRVYKSTGW